VNLHSLASAFASLFASETVRCAQSTRSVHLITCSRMETSRHAVTPYSSRRSRRVIGAEPLVVPVTESLKNGKGSRIIASLRSSNCAGGRRKSTGPNDWQLSATSTPLRQYTNPSIEIPLVPIRVGAHLPLKCLRVVEIVASTVHDDGTWTAGYVIVALKAKHFVNFTSAKFTTDSSISADSILHCVLPGDEIVDEPLADINLNSSCSLDAVIEKEFPVGETISRFGRVLLSGDPFEESCGVTTLAVLSIRPEWTTCCGCGGVDTEVDDDNNEQEDDSYAEEDEEMDDEADNDEENDAKTVDEDDEKSEANAHVSSMTGNAILSLDALEERLADFYCCRSCAEKNVVSSVRLASSTIGLATRISGTCTNTGCNTMFFLEPETIQCEDGEFLSGNPALWWYTINQQFMMSLQYIGKGVSHGAAILSFLGMRGKQAFSSQSTSWRTLEDILIDKQLRLSEEIMDENLRKSIIAHGPPGPDGLVKLTMCQDTGWNTRSSGNSFNSLSSQMFSKCAKTGSICDCQVLSKLCRKCQYHKSRGNEPPDHDCHQSHEGSSKSMEGASVVEAAKNLWERAKTIGPEISAAVRGAFLWATVTDDDSTMRANLKHPKSEKKSDSGKLPLDVPEVEKHYADPTHRTKTFSRLFYKMAGGSLANNPHRLTKEEAGRLKKYHGYCIHGCRGLGVTEMMRRAQAVYEHFFMNISSVNLTGAFTTLKD
jgi:hypothetical protein